ncbi:MAG: chemotaxis protein CheA [Candidatus Cloacimonetes bacterium]|nr:chemotaxis protein CheA [Candidatus Cloacimonadota bacterium]
MNHLQSLLIELSQDFLMINISKEKSTDDFCETLTKLQDVVPDELLYPLQECVQEVNTAEALETLEKLMDLLNQKCEERDFTFVFENEKAKSIEEMSFDTTIYSEVFSEDEDLISTFFEETLENLEALDLILNLWDETPEDLTYVNDIFRSFHTIKGMAGFLSLNDMEQISHCLEDLLTHCRDGKVSHSNYLTAFLFDGIDFLRVMYDQLLFNYQNGVEDKHNVNVDDFVRKGSLFVSDFESYKTEVNTKVEPIVEIRSINNDAPVAQVKSGKREIDDSFRVSTKKMDALIDSIGELVINHSSIANKIGLHKDVLKGMRDEFSQFKRIVNNLQNVSLSLRMIPIGNTFKKMNRVVRDTANKLNKDIILKTLGEQTEIDRSIVDNLYDPLMHMIRNACDHGIEDPFDREEMGKSAQGTITLSAKHKDGCVVIAIEDDGKGLSLEKIRQKAIVNGLIQEEDSLSKSEIHQLILKPGFSTAETVTNLSGRGVGMDVVVQAIESLRGILLIDSQEGKGSRVEIRLPLTLAIIDGMVIRIGDHKFIIPTISVRESIKISHDKYSHVLGRGEMILIREHLVPLVRCYDLLAITSDVSNPWDGLLVVVDVDGHRYALLVDELLGKQEIVIKSLGDHFSVAKWIAGGAILACGDAALILDVSKLIQLPKQQLLDEACNE